RHGQVLEQDSGDTEVFADAGEAPVLHCFPVLQPVVLTGHPVGPPVVGVGGELRLGVPDRPEFLHRVVGDLPQNRVLVVDGYVREHDPVGVGGEADRADIDITRHHGGDRVVARARYREAAAAEGVDESPGCVGGLAVTHGGGAADIAGDVADDRLD